MNRLKYILNFVVQMVVQPVRVNRAETTEPVQEWPQVTTVPAHKVGG
jgi:hypothetical protein